MEHEGVCVNIQSSPVTDVNTIQKMTFLYNALQDGWSVVKKKTNTFLLKNTKANKKFYQMITLRSL